MSIINFDNKFVKLALFATPSLLSRYPHYDYIHFAIIMLYFVLNSQGTILYNPVFWTSYLSSIGALFDEFTKAKRGCDLIEDSNIDITKCALYSTDVIISITLNTIAFSIGYIRGRGKVTEVKEATNDQQKQKKPRKQKKLK